jgi:diguanylate cyclase (GGDEF)-like protein
MIDSSMSSAVFFLVVNFVIAVCFSAVFAVVAVYSRWRAVALSFSAGLAIASLTMLCEFGVAYSEDPAPWAAGVYGTVLAGIIFLWIGIAELYGKPLPHWCGILTFAVGMVVYLLIQYIPRSSWLHPFLYQGSYALVVFAGSVHVFTSHRHTPLDRALGIVLLISGLHFLLKAALAVAFGAGATASDYITTHYAVFSQSITAIVIVAVGLLLLAVLMIDLMAEERGRAERDSLSGLRNRRGFEKGVGLVMFGRARGPHSVILCDLDHFKSINDTHGHHAGDMVISAFGKLLQSNTPAGAVVARIGGEEFAVFLPNMDSAYAVGIAEALRLGVRAMDIDGMPPGFVVTASFGISSLSGDDSLDDALRRADGALYQAKSAGRDRVQESGAGHEAVPAKRVGLSVVK